MRGSWGDNKSPSGNLASRNALFHSVSCVCQCHREQNQHTGREKIAELESQ